MVLVINGYRVKEHSKAPTKNTDVIYANSYPPTVYLSARILPYIFVWYQEGPEKQYSRGMKIIAGAAEGPQRKGL